MSSVFSFFDDEIGWITYIKEYLIYSIPNFYTSPYMTIYFTNFCLLNIFNVGSNSLYFYAMIMGILFKACSIRYNSYLTLSMRSKIKNQMDFETWQ